MVSLEELATRQPTLGDVVKQVERRAQCWLLGRVARIHITARPAFIIRRLTIRRLHRALDETGTPIARFR